NLMCNGGLNNFDCNCTNKVINVIKCCFLDLFVDILFLTVKIHLPLQLKITHSFASGQTCEIGRGSNTYFPHCIWSIKKKARHTQLGSQGESRSEEHTSELQSH